MLPKGVAIFNKAPGTDPGGQASGYDRRNTQPGSVGSWHFLSALGTRTRAAFAPEKGDTFPQPGKGQWEGRKGD